MQNDKLLNVVNLQFIVMGGLGLPLVLLLLFFSYTLGAALGINFDYSDQVSLFFYLIPPLFLLVMPIFLIRNYKWANWLGILILLFFSSYSLYQLIFYIIGNGFSYIINANVSSGLSLICVIWSYFSIKILYKIQKI